MQPIGSSLFDSACQTRFAPRRGLRRSQLPSQSRAIQEETAQDKQTKAGRKMLCCAYFCIPGSSLHACARARLLRSQDGATSFAQQPSLDRQPFSCCGTPAKVHADQSASAVSSLLEHSRRVATQPDRRCPLVPDHGNVSAAAEQPHITKGLSFRHPGGLSVVPSPRPHTHPCPFLPAPWQSTFPAPSSG